MAAAEKQGVVISISGDATDLNKALQDAAKSVLQLGNQAAKAGTDSGQQMAGGFKNGLKLIQGGLQDTASLARGGFAGIAESFLTLAVNPITIGAASIGAALIAAFKLVQVDEENKKIDKNFQILATNVGLNADYMKEKIGALADGFVDLDDILPQVGNAAQMLGKNAGSLPQIFELARNVGVQTGKDINQAFQDLSRGIALGNEKALRSAGIFIDTDKVLQDYAASLGVTVKQLSDTGKQQAILNAVLEKGKQNYSDTSGEVAPMEGGIRKLGLAFDSLKDAMAAIVNSKVGEYFAMFISGTADAVKAIADFASGTQKETNTITDDIKKVKDQIAEVQQMQLDNPNFARGYDQQLIELTNKLAQLQTIQDAVDAAQAQKNAPAKEDLIQGPSQEEIQKQNEMIIESKRNLEDTLAAMDDEYRASEAAKAAVLSGDKEALRQAQYQAEVDAVNRKYDLENQKTEATKQGEAQRAALAENQAKRALELQKLANKNELKELQDRMELEKQIRAANIQAIGNFISAGVTLAKEGSAEQKALMVLQAIWSTYSAATQALASPPGPPFTIPLAASVVAMGIANVAKITGAADGGMVTSGISGSVDTEPYLLARGEIIAPAKSFDEVIEGVARQRGYVKQEEVQTNNTNNNTQSISVVIQGDMIGDDAYVNRLANALREAVNYRDAQLA